MNKKIHAIGDSANCRKCSSPITVTARMVRWGKYICAACESKAAVARAKKNMAQKLAANKRYFGTPLGKAARSRHTRRFRERHPDRKAAHQAVQTAKRNGSLAPQPCEQCGNPTAEAHHDDYSKVLEVRWLCDGCHVTHHRAMLAESAKEKP